MCPISPHCPAPSEPGSRYLERGSVYPKDTTFPVGKKQSQGQTGQGFRAEGTEGLGNVCEGRNRSLFGALLENLCIKMPLMFLMHWGSSCWVALRWVSHPSRAFHKFPPTVPNPCCWKPSAPASVFPPEGEILKVSGMGSDSCLCPGIIQHMARHRAASDVY